MKNFEFYPASKRAREILIENPLKIFAINFIGDFLLFLIKITITSFTLILSLILLETQTDNVSFFVFYFIKILT